MRGPERRNLPAVEPLVPSPARVYERMLGGSTWSFDVDRRAAELLLDAEPAAADLARENRAFISRAARWIAGQGVRQFCDLGAGLPVSTFRSLHEVVREAAPDARTVYVDNDPVVFKGLAGVIAGTSGVTAVLGDLSDPAQIFRDLAAEGFDPSLPLGMSFGAVFHFLPPDQARTIVRRYAELAPPGSYLVVSVMRADGEHGARVRRAYRAAQTYNYGREEVTAWFSGLDLVPPGMTQARAWQPDRPRAQVPSAGGEVWCGVARTPAPGGLALAGIPGLQDAAAALVAAAGTLPETGWPYADRLLGLLDGKWPPIVIRYLPALAPGIRPAELRKAVNADRRANGEDSIPKGTLHACLARMVDQELAERTEARADTPVTFYRLTDQGQYALAALRRLAGAAIRPGSWADVRPPEGPGIDLSRPSIARVYDYWLGGKDSFPPDRELSGKLLQLLPQAPELARESRGFLARAVGYVAAQGVGQFIDIGAGLPTSPAVHEIARSRNPGARVLYVDNDPTAIVHARALLTGEGVAVAAGDAGDPGAILAAPALTRHIDLGEPSCVILAMILHFFDPHEAARITRTIISALAPGSYLIMSVGTTRDADLRPRFENAYTASRMHHHSPEQIAGYFGDLHLADPGLADARSWRGGPGPDASGERPTIILSGVGRKT
jgi:O-methyltransferase involved in polyketide biosynthesis/DNA-binding HxlR family transcriptional regulator